MRSMRALAAALVMLAGGAEAQTPAPDFATKLAGATSVLRVDDGALGGPGAAVLGSAVDAARYVLVGEAHFSREIPVLTAALCRRMAAGGLHALAVESGPEAARVIEADLGRSDRIARLAGFMRAHPDAMAFLNGDAEAAMVGECASAAGRDFQLWGLDQEFFGASGFLLDAMAAARPGSRARAAIARLRARDEVATREAVTSGSPAKFLIYTVSDAEMDAARGAIAADGGQRVGELFAALDETRAIFLASASGAGDPNGRRARLIKRTLAKYLAAAPAGARVLMKFGDVHMIKGVNALRQRDLGNYVAERADGEGVGSLHILTLGAEGRLSTYGGVGRQVVEGPYTPQAESDYPWLAQALAARPAGAGAGDWLLVDLRPLRALPTAQVDERWRRVVQGYDLVAIAPRLTPAKLVGAAE